MRMNGRSSDGKENYKIFTGMFKKGIVPLKGKITYSISGDEYYGEH